MYLDTTKTPQKAMRVQFLIGNKQIQLGEFIMRQQ
jgi:hypothetical protein